MTKPTKQMNDQKRSLEPCSTRQIPVSVARQISRDFKKQVVVINAWDEQAQLLCTVTFGESQSDKIYASEAGKKCARALGMDINQRTTYEDFKTLDAARNAEFRDFAERIIHVLRSYQFGNSEPGPAKDLADDIEKLFESQASSTP